MFQTILMPTSTSTHKGKENKSSKIRKNNQNLDKPRNIGCMDLQSRLTVHSPTFDCPQLSSHKKKLVKETRL